ncbi:hypothetical protein SAMD00023519_02069 [Listeria monocytogenes]|nr:hypothetical protein SAMD00023519_02069 [Listeria monocytogenes]
MPFDEPDYSSLQLEYHIYQLVNELLFFLLCYSLA